MSGWDLKSGEITGDYVSEGRYWSLFNFVFSDGSMKRNTYKFGLIKSILDNLFNGRKTGQGFYLSYRNLFAKFTENYWNLVVKYNLRQMRKDGRSEFSKIESILYKAVSENKVLVSLEFEAVLEEQKDVIIKQVMLQCKKCVIGALYEDFEGTLYSFDLKSDELIILSGAYEFMLKYKMQIEKLNYYSWAKFLEKINPDNVLVRVIDKLELAVPKRSDLSAYREILRSEIDNHNCFYCGMQLQSSIHVDHFIPWIFVKDNKLWNFVLSCPSCNRKKKNKVPTRDFLIKLEDQNKKIQFLNNNIVQTDFIGYSDGLLDRLWQYATLSGIKEYNISDI